MKTYGIWNIPHGCWATDTSGKIMEFFSIPAAHAQWLIEESKVAWSFRVRPFDEFQPYDKN